MCKLERSMHYAICLVVAVYPLYTSWLGNMLVTLAIYQVGLYSYN